MIEDQHTRNKLVRAALNNRLTVTLDAKIASLEQIYQGTQEKLVNRRNILLDQAKDAQ